MRRGWFRQRVLSSPLMETAPQGCVPFAPPDLDRFLDEPEGAEAGVELIDAHVHLFPDRVYDALYRWFEKHAWRCRYRLYAEQVVEHLTGRGVSRFCALHYSHKPGMSRELNRFAAEAARAHPQILPLGTVLPGEPDAREILREALGPLGLRGIKIHCHVQQLAPDDARLEEVYEECEAAGRTLVIHAGREPRVSGYGVDPHTICGAARMERVLQRHPKLRIVVPHLGADEFSAYLSLVERYDNLWLDTTMVVADYFQTAPPAELFPGRADRLLYGTDFPMLPYAWDHELRRIMKTPMSDAARRALLYDNALQLFD
jgi:predicted TIM-barrel fold metal-dependent hydrolase